MKLSISNIAWTKEYDMEMYSFLSMQGFTGLEVAPTRIFEDFPYQHIKEAKEFSKMLMEQYGLEISSIQSIWYGRTESIFGTAQERQALLEYTKQAIEYASAIQCKNIVFGCPQNRQIPSMDYLPIAYDFFAEIGEYAIQSGTQIAIEPNPTFYKTNFINSTTEAFEFCRRKEMSNIKVNVDLGTCITYNENVQFLNTNVDLINHVHISEPYLEPIERRAIHKELHLLNFNGYFSIEMANKNNIEQVKNVIRYIKEVLI